jgi:hypothetical protein
VPGSVELGFGVISLLLEDGSYLKKVAVLDWRRELSVAEIESSKSGFPVGGWLSWS